MYPGASGGAHHRGARFSDQSHSGWAPVHEVGRVALAFASLRAKNTALAQTGPRITRDPSGVAVLGGLAPGDTAALRATCPRMPHRSAAPPTGVRPVVPLGATGRVGTT